jgi:hypothetical protein
MAAPERPEHPLDLQRRTIMTLPSFGTAIKQRRDALRDIEVEVPSHYRRGVNPRRTYPHLCFRKAYAYLVAHDDIPDAQFVQGEAFIGGLGLHGWVELLGNVLFDGAVQRFYNARCYYEREHAVAFYKFTRDAALLIYDAVKRSGREPLWDWFARLGLPWGNRRKPLLVDVQHAKELLAAKDLLGPTPSA